MTATYFLELIPVVVVVALIVAIWIRKDEPDDNDYRGPRE